MENCTNKYKALIISRFSNFENKFESIYLSFSKCLLPLPLLVLGFIVENTYTLS